MPIYFCSHALTCGCEKHEPRLCPFHFVGMVPALLDALLAASSIRSALRRAVSASLLLRMQCRAQPRSCSTLEHASPLQYAGCFPLFGALLEDIKDVVSPNLFLMWNHERSTL